MNLGLKDKVAMVSGASQGLGFAVARALAHEGASVSIASRDEGRIRDAVACLEKESGRPVIGVAADLRSSDAIAHWYTATESRFGGVDLLFTNTGGPPPGQALTFDDAAWHEAFDLLVMSVVRLVRLVVPSMQARGGGAILVSTSTAAKEPIPNVALSNVLRASVAALAKTLANELGPRGIRVNHIMPGRITTDRMQALDRFKAETLALTLQEVEARSVSEIPLGRYGAPEEFGRQAAYLLSEAASYVNGATLPVDGGLLESVM